MSKIEDIQGRIDGALNSIGSIQRAEPAPFFYTRLQARLGKDEKNVWEKLGRVISRPAFALMSLSFVMLLNIFVLFQFSVSEKATIQASETSITDEYSSLTSYYALENAEP